MRCAALAFGVERCAEPADDQPPHGLRIAEPDFGLGRVNVDVDLVSRDLDEQRRNRVAVACEQVAIGRTKSADEETIFHRARIDEQILLIGEPAVEGR
jgi:hypothetical protein